MPFLGLEGSNPSPGILKNGIIFEMKKEKEKTEAILQDILKEFSVIDHKLGNEWGVMALKIAIIQERQKGDEELVKKMEKNLDSFKKRLKERLQEEVPTQIEAWAYKMAQYLEKIHLLILDFNTKIIDSLKKDRLNQKAEELRSLIEELESFLEKPKTSFQKLLKAIAEGEKDNLKEIEMLKIFEEKFNEIDSILKEIYRIIKEG